MINQVINIKMKQLIYFSKFFLLLVIVCVCIPRNVKAYSVLTHEAIVDAGWEKSLKPLLLKKYPGINDSILNIAHSYAYGGAIAPDMGYFPFGSHLFTNLVHYVRSGDFAVALIDEAQNVNEYAFALGYLSHYMADRYGHLIGTNKCVPLVYPKMKNKFGDVVTYEDDKISPNELNLPLMYCKPLKEIMLQLPTEIL
jgi:Zinc dependent phospholipase C